MKSNCKAVVITTLKWRPEHQTSGEHRLLSKQFCQILTCASSIYCKSLLNQNLHFTFLRMPTASPLFNHLPSTVECFLSSSCLIKLRRGEKIKKGQRTVSEVPCQKMGFHGDSKTNLPTNKVTVPPYSLPIDISHQKAVYSDKFCPGIVLWVKFLMQEYKHHRVTKSRHGNTHTPEYRNKQYNIS